MIVNGTKCIQVGHKDDLNNFNVVNDPNINNLVLMGGFGDILCLELNIMQCFTLQEPCYISSNVRVCLMSWIMKTFMSISDFFYVCGLISIKNISKNLSR